MKKRVRNIILLTSLLLFIGIGYTQKTSRKESDKLRTKQKQLQKKINFTKSLLGDTRKNKKLTAQEISLLNRQINYREQLILTINHQIIKIDEQVKENKSIIEALEKDIELLKKQHEEILINEYKRRNKYHKLMFVIASDDFNQGYKRAKYLQQLTTFRKRQVKLITDSQEKLKQKLIDLEKKKAEKIQLLGDKKIEKEQYSSDQETKKLSLNNYKSEEQRLRRVLNDQEKKKRKLATAIRKAIRKEIAASAKKSSSKSYSMTPEAKQLSQQFEGNKGKLPWPVVRGEITGKYGKNAHPVLAGIFVNNNGIDISTSSQAEVRAIFSGTVSSVFVIPGAGKAAMISHGAYRTVYANLKEAYVTKGDKVSTKQRIGVLLPNKSGKASEAHLEIWKISGNGMEKLNPSGWIFRK